MHPASPPVHSVRAHPSAATEPVHDRALVWLRRDLRVHDNAALYHALRSARQVWVAFVFDRDILDALPRADRRLEFIHDAVVALDRGLRELAGQPKAGLIVRHGHGAEEVVRLARELGAQAVHAAHDDEPAALARDTTVRGALANAGVVFQTCKDHCIFERDEVLTQSGTSFSVFTPYKNAWLKKVNEFYLRSYPVERHAARLAARPDALCRDVPALAELGFETTNLHALGIHGGEGAARALVDDFSARMTHYGETRDYPAVKGPSYLSVHLRFGTVSIRELARLAHGRMTQGDPGAAVWLSELIWRDFYFQILSHHPHAAQRSFKPAYDAIRWEHGKHAEALFAAWCEGRTGYPIVDAAIAQINTSGYMHNRLRMVVASFLTKDLGLDWRWGERYFALKLNDFDLAANNGGWQWASSSGCDAQPYFRIFNPVSQSEKFDPEGRFIRRYLPPLARLPDLAIHAPWLARPIDLAAAGIELGRDYPRPIVAHDEARARTLARYAVVKASA